MDSAGSLQAAQEDPARTASLLAEVQAAEAAQTKPRVSASPPPAQSAQPAASFAPLPAAAPPPRKASTVRYADLEESEPSYAAPAPPRGAPARTDSTLSEYPLPLRVAPDWTRVGGSGAAPGRSASQGLGAAAPTTQPSKRADLEAAVAAAAAEEESYEVIDRASCCWRCARLTAVLVVLSVNNVIVCILAAYLARSAWFDSWFNGTGLRALSSQLAVTVPRCSAAEVLAIRMSRANVTNATALAANTTLPPGSLLADGMGRVCGLF